MNINSDSRYLSYELTEIELLTGAILTVNQLAVVQNKLSIAAEELLNIKVDPSNILTFVQQQAYLQSKVDTLQQMIDDSKEAVATLDVERNKTTNLEQ